MLRNPTLTPRAILPSDACVCGYPFLTARQTLCRCCQTDLAVYKLAARQYMLPGRQLTDYYGSHWYTFPG